MLGESQFVVEFSFEILRLSCKYKIQNNKDDYLADSKVYGLLRFLRFHFVVTSIIIKPVGLNYQNLPLLYLADQALMYFPMRRALSLAKNGAWYLSHIDDAVMAEFLMAPVIIPSGRLHMWPKKITNENQLSSQKNHRTSI